MTYTASSELIDRIIKLSAEIVVGLGTTLPADKAEDVYARLNSALEELDVADSEPSGRHERALVKAANRAAQNYRLEWLSGTLSAQSDLARYREELNFESLSKALMAFEKSETVQQVNHLLPTVYVWQEPLPVGVPIPCEEEDQPHWRVQPFIEGRPIEAMDSRLCSVRFKSREAALEAVRNSDFGVTMNQIGGVSPHAPGPDVYQVVDGVAPKPYLYILMRNDLASLNAGKAVAQGSHAANQMVSELRKQTRRLVSKPDSIFAALGVWEEEANGFGTCIVLSVNEKQMRASVAKALDDALPSHAGICHDPTYPLLDGATCHHIPVDTCAYVFDYPARAKRHLVGYPLMP